MMTILLVCAVMVIVCITIIRYRLNRLHKDEVEPAVYCSTCEENIIEDRQAHDVPWVLKFECSHCGEVMFITFEHAGFGLTCDADGNLL